MLYEEIDDRANTGKLLTTLGGLTFLLGKPDESIPLFKQAFAVALEVESDADAAQAVSPLAQVHLRTGQLELAEQQAGHALDLLADEVDFIDEIGNAQLVLGRSLLEQGRLLEEPRRSSRAAEEALRSCPPQVLGTAAWTRSPSSPFAGARRKARSSSTSVQSRRSGLPLLASERG